MTSTRKSFRSKSVETEQPRHYRLGRVKFNKGSKPKLHADPHALNKRDLEFSTVSSRGEHLACSARTHQALRMMGYDNTQIRDTLHTAKVLSDLASRPVDAVVFSSIRERNNLGLGAMASVAAICDLRAADVGITLKSAARLYARNKKRADPDTMERFVKWCVSRGEVINGLPSAWNEYNRIFGRKAVRSKFRGYKTASRKRRSRRSAKKSRKSRSSRRRKPSRKKSRRKLFGLF